MAYALRALVLRIAALAWVPGGPLIAPLVAPWGAWAEGSVPQGSVPLGPVQLTIKDHRFTPAEVSVAAGERFRIEVVNEDATPAEFESAELRVEKIVVPGGRISVMAGPLKPGTYKFFDDYHPDVATGTVVARAKE